MAKNKITTLISAFVPKTSTADEATANSLRFMATSLLIIGLVTSWLGIAPFTFSMLSRIVWEPLAYCLTVGICILLSMLIDFPLGKFVPAFFGKLSSMYSDGFTKEAFTKSLAILSLAFALSYLTMHLSSTGGEMTAKMLFDGERPETHGINAAQHDSLKHVQSDKIRKSFAAEMDKAQKADAQILADAKKRSADAQRAADQKFPNFQANQWQRKEYLKAIGAARIDSSALVQSATKAAVVEAKINQALYSSVEAFEKDLEAKEKGHKQEWADYQHKVNVANTLLRDLGYYATPLFWLITALAVLMGLKESVAPASANTQTNTGTQTNQPPSFAVITKHLTQYLTRLADAVSQGNDDVAKTNARNILDIYDKAEFHYKQEFEAMQKRHAISYPIWKRDEIEKFAS